MAAVAAAAVATTARLHWSKASPTHQLERQAFANHLDRIEPSCKHQVGQQSVAATARLTSTASNPDPFNHQRCPQPTPVPTPAHQPAKTLRTPLRRDHDMLTSRRVARRRQCTGPYDGHRGACTTLPALLVAQRLGGPLIQLSAAVLCAARASP